MRHFYILVVLGLGFSMAVVAMDEPQERLSVRVACQHGGIVEVRQEDAERVQLLAQALQRPVQQRRVDLPDLPGADFNQLLELLRNQEAVDRMGDDRQLAGLIEHAQQMGFPDNVQTVLGQRFLQLRQGPIERPVWNILQRTCKTVRHMAEAGQPTPINEEGQLNLAEQQLRSLVGVTAIPCGDQVHGIDAHGNQLGDHGLVVPQDMPVQSIDARQNGMRVLKRGFFSRLPRACQRLDLRDNDIQQVEPGAFTIPQQDLTVDCSGNRLPAQEIQRLARQVEPSRLRTFLHGVARAATGMLAAMRWTSPIWATLLRIKLFEKYGHTMAYRAGNVLLNIDNAIKSVRARNYVGLPSLAVDSCYNIGYLDHVEQHIKRKTGLSMSGINKDARYGFGWWAGLVYQAIGNRADLAAQRPPNSLRSIAWGIYDLPRAFDSSSLLSQIDRELIYPCLRWGSWQGAWWRTLGYIHGHAARLEQVLARRNHVIADHQRI